MIFLNRNAYDVPVYEELLKQDIIHVEDVDRAFLAYASSHELDEETKEHFEKLIKLMKEMVDVNGDIVSDEIQLENLKAYKKASPGNQVNFTNALPVQTSVNSEIPNPNNLGSWENVGPFGNPEVHWSATGNGALDHVEFHPTAPSIMYVSSRNGGVWKTTNYGKNWKPISQAFAIHTSCFEVCPANPTTLYIGGRTTGIVWYSNDDGATWENRRNQLSGQIYDIHSEPADENRVLVATTQGIYLSTDAGQNWVKKIPGFFTDIDVSDDWSLIVVSKNGTNLPASLYFTQDKGDNWTEEDIITNPAIVDRFYLAMHEKTNGIKIVYAFGLVNNNQPSRFIGLWKSDFDPNPSGSDPHFNFTRIEHPTYDYPNGPVNLRWQAADPGYYEDHEGYGSINPHSSSAYMGEFWVSPNDSTHMALMKEKFWGCDNEGIVWKFKPSYGNKTWADNRYITMNTARDTFFWCNDGGLWAIKESDLFPTADDVDNSGMSERDYVRSKVVGKNGDICVIEGSQLDVSHLNKGVFITGGQDIGQLFTRNGRDSHVASSDVYRGRIKPTDDSLFITGHFHVFVDGSNMTLEKEIRADHFNPDRIYGVTQETSNHLVRTKSGYDGWVVNHFKNENHANVGGGSNTATHPYENVDISSTGIAHLKAVNFEQSRANPEIAFVADEQNSTMFMTSNLSSTTPTWIQLPNAPLAGKYRIATHPYNENLVAIATEVGVFISKDKGNNWYKRTALPPFTDPRTLLFDKKTDEDLYLNTGLTVLYLRKDMESWAEFNKGLPNSGIVGMEIRYFGNGDDRLYVGQYGKGIWSTSLQRILDSNGDLPIADFNLFGKNSHTINIGDEVSIVDLSLNADSLNWVIENGTDIINVGNNKYPKVVLNTTGFYKVTLTAVNNNGSDINTKERYIQVITAPIDPSCIPVNDGSVSPSIRYDKVKVAGDVYTVNNNSYYFNANHTFSINATEPSNFFISDRGTAYYYDVFNFYTKVWIDYNNDGDFDDVREEIVDGGSPKDTVDVMFTPPAGALLNVPLNMRVAGVTDVEPDSCNNVGYRQNIDFKIILTSSFHFVNTSHIVLSKNSASLFNEFQDAINVFEAGFVYSPIDVKITKENASYVVHNGGLANDDKFTDTIANLDYSIKYYYRPYVIDDSGIHYGAIQSFQLAPHNIPLAESIIAINYQNNDWTLKGRVFPSGNILSSVVIEHGVNSFAKSDTMDLSGLDFNHDFDILTIATLSTMNTNYQFRVKINDDQESYYSNTYYIHTNQSICKPPTVNNMAWYTRFNQVKMNGITHNEVGSNKYEDATNVVFNVDIGKTYKMNLKSADYSGSWHFLTYLVYIDYNNDGDFNDYHEIVGRAPVSSTIYDSLYISIPTENIIADQNLLMRVIGYHSTPIGPCHIGTGNIKDFSINISKCQSVIYVDGDANGNNSGLSWDNAYLNLEDALNNYTCISMVDTIKMAEGVYIPNTVDRHATYSWTDSIVIEGGFKHGGLAQDPTIYISTLSGDIGVPGDPSDNLYHVIHGMSANSLLGLKDITITGGYADGTGIDMNGGGIYCDGYLVLENILVTGNSAKGQGEGIYNSNTCEEHIEVSCTLKANSHIP